MNTCTQKPEESAIVSEQFKSLKHAREELVRRGQDAGERLNYFKARLGALMMLVSTIADGEGDTLTAGAYQIAIDVYDDFVEINDILDGADRAQTVVLVNQETILDFEDARRAGTPWPHGINKHLEDSRA